MLLYLKLIHFNKYYPRGNVGNKCSIWVSLWSMRCLCHWILMRWWAIASVCECITYMNHCCHRGEYITGNSWGRRGLIIRCMCVYMRAWCTDVCVWARGCGGQLGVCGYLRFPAVTCNIALSKIEKSHMGRTFACKWTGSHRQDVTHLV